MRVVQSTLGRFHHFDLARQMLQRHALECVFTGYPKWKLNGEGLPPRKIRSFPWLHTLYMARGRFGLTQRWLSRELGWQCHLVHDRYTSRNMPECDVFIGMSGISLQSGLTVQRRGGKYFCDRGSAHIAAHDDFIAAEYRRRKLPYERTDPRDRNREECEYVAADLITVPSRFALKSFADRGVPTTKLRRVPYGMDLQRFQRCGEPEPGTFQVLFVGNVSPAKGIFYLLKAFKQLRHPRKQLLLAGTVAPDFREALAKALPEQVTLAGHVPQMQLPLLMSRSHVLVLPSLSDGFGLVLGQALSCGCPVIASDRTGGPDLIINGKEGFIVPAGDSVSLAEKLEQLCQDQQLYPQMSIAARQRAKALGGWNVYGDEMYRLCQECAVN